MRSEMDGATGVAYGQATRAVAIGLLVNLLLGATKLAGGLLGRSFALIADAVNSLGDALVSLTALFALRFAQRPADEAHPYGHTRAEGIAASHIALLIVISALLVGWEALTRIRTTHDLPPGWTLWLAGGNVLIKEGLYRYKIRVGRRTGSQSVMAHAWDHRSDALCSLAVLVGLAVVRWGGPSFIWADELAALVVVVVILFGGVRLLVRSASELMDMQGDPERRARVERCALSIEGVLAVETLRLRKSGLEFFTDIHIEVDAGLTVAEGHAIAHRVKDAILESGQRVRDVLVHVEPHRHTDRG